MSLATEDVDMIIDSTAAEAMARNPSKADQMWLPNRLEPGGVIMSRQNSSGESSRQSHLMGPPPRPGSRGDNLSPNKHNDDRSFQNHDDRGRNHNDRRNSRGNDRTLFAYRPADERDAEVVENREVVRQDNWTEDHRPSRDSRHARDRSRSPDRAGHRRDYRQRSPRRENYRPHGDRHRSDDHSYDRRASEDRRHRGRSEHEDAHAVARQERDMSQERQNWVRRQEEERERAPPKEKLTEEEGDRVTVFVQQCAIRAREKDIERFFTKAGVVDHVSIVKDRVSKRSKGLSYVTFTSPDAVTKAVAMTGQKMLGIPVIVQICDSEKNRIARKSANTSSLGNGPISRLYVGNIHFSIGEDDLRELFSAYGEVEVVQLQKEDGGRSKGYGFVQFALSEDAKGALSALNGMELAGRPMRVGIGNEKQQSEMGGVGARAMPDRAKDPAGPRDSEHGGRDGHRGHVRKSDKVVVNVLDDDEAGGVNYNNYSREALMKKLARTEDGPLEGDRNITGTKPVVDPRKAPIATMKASRCIVIKNAYNEQEEAAADPNWKAELGGDFKQECSNKYGEVVFLQVYPDRGDGEVFVKFKELSGGDAALKGLNGRIFASRTLKAEPVVDMVFNTMFPHTVKL